MRRLRTLAAVALIALPFLAGGTLAQTPKPAHERCIIPDQPVIDWIELGLYPDDGTHLRHVWAVKSDDFENVWFVAADLEGPGMEGDGEIAIWATNALASDGKPQPDGGGFVWWANHMAEEFADWPHGQLNEFEEYDGMDDAKDCAKGDEQRAPTATP